MNDSGPFRLMEISASGLGAEHSRLSVIFQNIANASVTPSSPGEAPYRRQHVMFQTVLEDSLARKSGVPVGGVRVSGVRSDSAAFRRVRMPGHPAADADGWVRMPNVDIATEMVDMLDATRTYEANLSAFRVYREMTRQTMAITR